MSLLEDFAGRFLQLYGQESMRRSEEDRQLRLQDALEQRRRKYRQEDAEAERLQRQADWVEQQNLSAQPRVGYDEAGQFGLLSDSFLMGDDGRISRHTRRLGDAPKVPDGKPFRVERGDSVEYRQRYTDNSEEIVSKAPRYKPQDGSARVPRDAEGFTPVQRATEERAKANDARTARKDALAEARARAQPFLDQINVLDTAPDKSGGSPLSRFMAQHGAPRNAQTSPFEAKRWIVEREQAAALAEAQQDRAGGDGYSDADTAIADAERRHGRKLSDAEKAKIRRLFGGG